MKIEEIEVGKKYWNVHGSSMTCIGKGEGLAMMVFRPDHDYGCPMKPESIICEFVPIPEPIHIEYRFTPRPWWRFGF